VRTTSFGNPDLPPGGSVNVTDPNALKIPGPRDAAPLNVATKD